MRKIGVLIVFSIMVSSALGQTRQAFLSAAEAAFDSRDYYSALHYYQTALEFDDQQIDILFKAAQAARLFNAYNLAEQYYSQVIELEQNGEYPLASFYVAEMQHKLGKYNEAIQNYQLYITENSGDNIYFTNRSTSQIDDCNWALTQINDPLDFIEVEHMGESVNTAYSEYGPFLTEDTLYYASLRFEEETELKGPKRVWSKGLISVNDEDGVVLDSTYNQPGEIHTGHMIFNTDKTRLYYTLCEYKYASEIRCDIFYRDLENGVWSDPIAMPFNDTSYTTTQPALGRDPMGFGDALYFVSNRPGSKKLDIWYATIGDGGFGSPMNLMEINTEEDDITPFYHMEADILYFSSEGYQGFGGFDVYSAYFNNGTQLTVDNLGTPINTSYNDIYYHLTEDEQNGYMVSNREGAYYVDDDKQACCNDLYRVTISDVDIDLIAETYEKVSQEELLGATVKLFELAGGQELIDSASLPNAYQYTLPLLRNRSYMLVGEKSGYFPDTLYFTTRGIDSSQTLTKKLFLMPRDLSLEILVFDDETREAIRGATVSIQDLSDRDIETVVQVNEDDNRFAVALDRDKSYQIITSKKGYKADTMTISTFNIPDTRITRNVFLKRGGPEDFLPLQVFFDNDQPEEKSWRRTTNKTYAETYPGYYAKKEEYKELFTEPLRGQAKIEAQDDIERFFENEVKVGNTDLDRFIEILAQELEKGEKFELVIQGFASPRASAAYNLRLSLRRISSLLNQVNEYSAGILRTYIRNGQLKITDEAIGEERAPIYVSDAIEDTRNSVYSVPASRERRVEIIDVKRF